MRPRSWGSAKTLFGGQVQATLDSGEVQRREAAVALAGRLSKDLLRRPAEVANILNLGQTELEHIDHSRQEYAESQMLELIELMDQNFENRRCLTDLATGWPIFDNKYGGIPSKHVFISMPGKGDHGKTSFAVELCRRLIMLKPDGPFLYLCMVDGYHGILPKIIAAFGTQAAHLSGQEPLTINEVATKRLN